MDRAAEDGRATRPTAETAARGWTKSCTACGGMTPTAAEPKQGEAGGSRAALDCTPTLREGGDGARPKVEQVAGTIDTAPCVEQPAGSTTLACDRRGHGVGDGGWEGGGAMEGQSESRGHLQAPSDEGGPQTTSPSFLNTTRAPITSVAVSSQALPSTGRHRGRPPRPRRCAPRGPASTPGSIMSAMQWTWKRTWATQAAVAADQNARGG